MNINIQEKQNIEINFNKDNIYLGFINTKPNKIISNEEVDVFYKEGSFYKRFVDDGTKMYEEILKGDGSDGKGTISDITSIWEYYKEDKVIEIKTDDIWIIGVEDINPIKKYQKDHRGKIHIVF